jgi:beta-1,4-N-acetylglucosaminyltransferase
VGHHRDTNLEPEHIEKKPMKVLAILGEGGHTTETLRIVELLGPIYDYCYLVPAHDQLSEHKIKLVGPVYRAVVPRWLHPRFWGTLWLSLSCTVQELGILLRARPRAILSTGAGIAVPISILGRLAGVKVIYVETATRVHRLSFTGKIMYRIAHLFFVQWEQLKDNYPKAIYAGRIM